jgi:hypothetical protein
VISIDFACALTRRVCSGLEQEFGAERVCWLRGRVQKVGVRAPRLSGDEARHAFESEALKLSCVGHDVGRYTWIIVFISTTRAAILDEAQAQCVELGDAPHRTFRH